ncbi:LOW QUALITY PROTEIN: prolyl aminopeptidase, partial [Micromonospora sp. M42]
ERAARDWCDWEDVHVSLAGGYAPDPRFADPVFRYGFARLVTHYFANRGFQPDGQVLRDAGRLARIPGVLVQGRLDVSGPPDIAWLLTRDWPDKKAGDRGVRKARKTGTASASGWSPPWTRSPPAG